MSEYHADDVTAAVARELLDYDASAGTLRWRPRACKWFANPKTAYWWNSRYAETPAFTTQGDSGYLIGALFNRKYRAHRIAWLHYYGEWPVEHVDHINHDRTDNRIDNLRSATRTDNNRNMSRSKANTSGVTGVNWHKAAKNWQARIYVEGECVVLGYFNDIVEAASARKHAEIKYGYHANHGKVMR